MFTPHGLRFANFKRANRPPIILTEQMLRQAAKRLSNINIAKVDCRARINRHTPGWNALQTMRAPGNGLANIQEPWHAYLLRNNPGPEKDVRNFRAVPLKKPEAPFTLNKSESQVKSEDVKKLWDELEKQTDDLKVQFHAKFEGQIFVNIPCPLNGQVYVHNPGHSKPSPIHANQMKIPLFDDVGAKVIAAQQPNGKAKENDKFLRMLHQNADVVIDLRKNSDIDKNPSVDYAENIQNYKHVKLKSQQKDDYLGVPRRSLQIEVKGKKKTVDVLKFRDWPDHGVITPKQLRNLREIMSAYAANKKSVVVHCRAGVGRTGTLIAYTALYDKLITKSKESLSPQQLLKHVLDEILALRKQRGPAFVQTSEQLQLIVQTLMGDLAEEKRLSKTDHKVPDSRSRGGKAQEAVHKNNGAHNKRTQQAHRPATPKQDPQSHSQPAAPRSSHKRGIMKDPNIKGSSLSPEQIDAVKRIWQNLESVDQNQPKQADGVEVIYPDIPCFAENVLHANITENGKIDSKSVRKPIHANNVTFTGFNQQFQLAQAPHTPSDVWRHWHAIFEEGSDVTEIVNPHTSDTPGSSGQLARLFGLNFIHPRLLNKKLNIQIGSHRIESIAEIPHETNRLDSNKYDERRYNLNVVNEKTGKLKTINYRLIKADFSNRVLKAQHLYRMIKGNHSSTNKPMWISSQCGIGRPSALMMAHALKQGIEDGKIRADNLDRFMESFIQQGRSIRGPLFVHNKAQLEQLYVLAHKFLQEKENKQPVAQGGWGRHVRFEGVVTETHDDILSPWFQNPPKPSNKADAKGEPIESLTIKSFKDLLDWLNITHQKHTAAGMGDR